MIKFAGFNDILMKQKIIYKTIAAAALILSAAVSCEWVDKCNREIPPRSVRGKGGKAR